MTKDQQRWVKSLERYLSLSFSVTKSFAFRFSSMFLCRMEGPFALAFTAAANQWDKQHTESDQFNLLRDIYEVQHVLTHKFPGNNTRYHI
jgi:hypothetical protein